MHPRLLVTTVGFSIVSFSKLHNTVQCLSKNLELFLQTPFLAACRVNSANCVGFFGNYILGIQLVCVLQSSIYRSFHRVVDHYIYKYMYNDTLSLSSLFQRFHKFLVSPADLPLETRIFISPKAQELKPEVSSSRTENLLKLTFHKPLAKFRSLERKLCGCLIELQANKCGQCLTMYKEAHFCENSVE